MTEKLKRSREGLEEEVKQRTRELLKTNEQLSLLQGITMEVAVARGSFRSFGGRAAPGRVCQNTGWVVGQAWVPHADGSVLDCSPAWFCGVPGKEPAWIRDISLDKNFPRSPHAAQAGLKAGFGIPILANNQVIAVLEFFMQDSREEDTQLSKVIVAVTAQLGLAIERKSAEEASHAF